MPDRNVQVVDHSRGMTRYDPIQGIPATESAFGFTHLTETILLHMRIKDLLVNAQRVSKQWKFIIDNSSRLQQALFFEPLTGGPIKWGRGDEWRERAPDDFFRPRWYPDRSLWDCDNNHGSDSDVSDDEDCVDDDELDPITQRTVVFDNPFRRQVRRIYMNRRNYSGAGDRLIFEAFKEALGRDSASWRRMLACQAPIMDADTGYRPLAPVISKYLASHSGKGLLTMKTLLGSQFVYDESRYWELYIFAQDVKIAQDVRRIEFPNDEFEFEPDSDEDEESVAIPPVKLKILFGSTKVVETVCELYSTVGEVKDQIAWEQSWYKGSITLLHKGKVMRDDWILENCDYAEGTFIWGVATQQ